MVDFSSEFDRLVSRLSTLAPNLILVYSNKESVIGRASDLLDDLDDLLLGAPLERHFLLADSAGTPIRDKLLEFDGTQTFKLGVGLKARSEWSKRCRQHSQYLVLNEPVLDLEPTMKERAEDARLTFNADPNQRALDDFNVDSVDADRAPDELEDRAIWNWVVEIGDAEIASDGDDGMYFFLTMAKEFLQCETRNHWRTIFSPGTAPQKFSLWLKATKRESLFTIS